MSTEKKSWYNNHAQSARCALGTLSKYITRSEDGVLDVAGLISKECYEEWLASRLKLPKNPSEAFRKTITSHCRGDEGMTPFEPDVEAAVLSLLRKKSIWPCFKGTDKKIGERGFQAMGYWEGKDRQEKEDALLDTLLEPSRKRSLRRTSTTLTDEDVIPFGEEIGDSLELGSKAQIFDLPYFLSKMYIDNEKLYGRENMLQYEAPDQDVCGSVTVVDKLTAQQIDYIVETFRDLIKKQEGVFKDGLEAFFGFVGEPMAAMILIKIFRQLGLGLFYPRQLPMKLHMDGNTQFFFSKDFVLPPKEECYFFKWKPIGLVVGDPITLSPIDTDEAAQDLYRGDIVGTTSLKLRVHKAQGFMFLRECLQEYVTKGEVWTRSIEYRKDGTIMVLLNKYYKKDIDPSSCYVSIQDVTDQYYHLL